MHSGQDVLSETFLAAIRSLQNGSVTDNVAGWLIGISRNKVADWYRQRKRSATTEIDTDVPEKPLGNHLIADVLDELGDDERVVLEWKYIDRCTVGEIAERLGRTDKAVEALLYRARKSFRSHYDSSLE
jgi:RNA polymerase sigma-70 factor (ECF subfamily)